ncbi:dCTP pyrophosphatase 1-like [Octopus sinensis]|uniref:dCTP pyrophosphatase 1-like n=1 Tax=Octopus sinensis TaxID=2607531 RepID=A0A6P7TSP9_9MOLL|nr:dCTP pyrophosphatase 1-like [Octopus sinensis]
MAAFNQKLQAVLWLAELKSTEAVRVKWTENYAEEPPTDQMLLTWEKNFQATENIHSNGDVGTSPPKQPRQNGEITRLEDEPEFKFSLQTTLEDIRQKQEDFCLARNRDQYQTPRNILLALVGEVGELAEIFQWKGEVKQGLPEFSECEKEHVGEEMSDVLIYLIWLAHRCRVDLPSAALRKFQKNAKKYPADRVFGKSNKYTDYEDQLVN